MSESGKAKPTTPIRINFDPAPIQAAAALLAKDAQRVSATLTARAVFGMAYKGDARSARKAFGHLSPEERAKVAEAARMLVQMDEEEPTPVNLADPETW